MGDKKQPAHLDLVRQLILFKGQPRLLLVGRRPLQWAGMDASCRSSQGAVPMGACKLAPPSFHNNCRAHLQRRLGCLAVRAAQRCYERYFGRRRRQLLSLQREATGRWPERLKREPLGWHRTSNACG